MKYGIWSEFLPYYAVQADLPVLKAYQVDLLLAIPAERAQSPALIELLKAAQALDITVGGWILLPDEQGYWPGSRNVSAFAEQTQRVLDYLATHQLHLPWIIVDMEPDLHYSQLLQTSLKRQAWPQLQAFIQQQIDSPEFYQQACAHYQQLIDHLHQQNSQVMVVTYPLIVDDALHQLTFWQRLLHIPVNEVAWDKISLLTYRSSFSQLSGLRLSAAMVQQYILDAKQLYQAPIAADLGVIGLAEKLPGQGGICDPQLICDDVAAAKIAQADEIHLFSLDGLHQNVAPRDWLRTLETPERLFKPNWADRTLRQVLQGGGKMLRGR